MRTRPLFLFALPIWIIFSAFSLSLSGGPIIVNMAPGGNIDVGANGSFENAHGAMFWVPGTGWGVNDTYGHTYFTDQGTGLKIKDFITSTAPVTAAGSGVEILRIAGPAGLEYVAVHNRYTYQKTAGTRTYSITASEIVITMVQSGTNTKAGPGVVLRSRSANASTATPYFDVYIENEDGTTEALRSDPVWYHYPMSPEQALLRTDPSEYRMGFLPTLSSQYWLDIDGGSEMGGKTFKLITGSFLDTELDRLGTSFVIQVAVQYSIIQENPRELLFNPYVYSISDITAAPLHPSITAPAISGWGSAALILILSIPAVWFLGRRF